MTDFAAMVRLLQKEKVELTPPAIPTPSTGFDRARAKVLRQAGVVGAGRGNAEKLVVYVRDQHVAALVPDLVDGFKTDVEVVGDVRAY